MMKLYFSPEYIWQTGLVDDIPEEDGANGIDDSTLAVKALTVAEGLEIIGGIH